MFTNPALKKDIKRLRVWSEHGLLWINVTVRMYINHEIIKNSLAAQKQEESDNAQNMGTRDL